MKTAVITLQELCHYLAEELQVDLFSDYCVNGLQVEGRKEVFKLATAVSASAEVIEKAVRSDADALLVHHGLFWRGETMEIVGPKHRKIKALLSNNLSLLCYHLPLDANERWGNNWHAAVEMGWKELSPFGTLQGRAIGVKGRFAPTPIKVFQSTLESYYSHPAHIALGGKESVASAALVSGGAYRLIPEAAKEGVDCFITGNFDEPAWHLAHEERVNFFALGHHATERIGPRTLGTHLAEQFGIETLFLDQDNPF